jgi:hypothetical protein
LSELYSSGLQKLWKISKQTPPWPIDAYSTQVAEAVVVPKEEALYLLVLGLGVCIVNGTTSREHMEGDLGGWNTWKEWLGKDGNEVVWEGFMKRFRINIGDDVI